MEVCLLKNCFQQIFSILSKKDSFQRSKYYFKLAILFPWFHVITIVQPQPGYELINWIFSIAVNFFLFFSLVDHHSNFRVDFHFRFFPLHYFHHYFTKFEFYSNYESCSVNHWRSHNLHYFLCNSKCVLIMLVGLW